MKYLNPTFSLPVSNGRMTDEEYAIAVGGAPLHTNDEGVESTEEGCECGCSWEKQ